MYQQFPSIRSPYRCRDSRSLLNESTSILLGISKAAAKALEDVGICNVFDLACSELFAMAVDICLLAENGTGRFAVIGKVPHDALRKGHNKSLSELPLQPIAILNTHAQTTKLDALAVAIDIVSIRDLAGWPPYHAAREIFDRAYNPLSLSGTTDSEAPADLIPANNEYPTERVQYEVLIFDQFIGGKQVGGRRAGLGIGSPIGLGLQLPQPLGSDGALDISSLLSTEKGYERPAIGGVLTFTQSWFTKGLALGNLIHGVALAPGESTKIAVIDWVRKTRTSVTEDIEESEVLISDLSRSRAISEITRAVAKETQEGQSAAKSTSRATQTGSSSGSAGFRDLGLKDMLKMGLGFGITSPGVTTSGSSYGESTGETEATSWSTSSGTRDVAAELSQSIADRTHQASHLCRSRRASIVREVSQKESESISTRTLTNYNHMHALTVQYYEVVQLYRTVVELSKVERCLFVPMKLINFSKPRIVDRFRNVIATHGLRADVRALLLAEPEKFAFWAPNRVGPWDAAKIEITNRLFGNEIGFAMDSVLAFPPGFKLSDIFFDRNVPFDSLIVTLASGEIITLPLMVEDAGPGGAGGPLYGYLHGVMDERSRELIRLLRERLHEIRQVAAQKKKGSENFSGNVTVNLYHFSDDPRIDGPFFPLSWTIKVDAGSAVAVLFELQPTVSTKKLVQHLQDNRLHYSQVIWRALDPATIGILLSGYTWPVGNQAKSLIELVDPTPVATIANYLVFKVSGDDDDERVAWLKKKNIKEGSYREDLIPVPSGGVFAEAVLGRFNSAEKLDITRFWNWQDSPIPIQAPDIAAIQAGSRREADNTVPGQLGTPVLNIVNPTSLPDPQGMGAILSAIQNGNMFRDMSGLAATIGLAQAGLTGTQQCATDAAAQAGQNAAVAAQLGAKVAELAAKFVAAYASGGASLAAGAGAEGFAGLAGGISGQGGKLNYGKDMDKRGISSQASGRSPYMGSSGAFTADNPVPTHIGTGDGSNGNESAAFDAALGTGSGGGVFSAIPRVILESVLGASSTEADLSKTKATIALIEKLVKTDLSKFGTWSKKHIQDMRDKIDANKILGVGVVAGSIIVWIPKALEDIVMSPAHTAEQISDVAQALIGLPNILRNRLKLIAGFAYVHPGLTPEETNYWDYMIRLLN
jgi:hypothetical protein